MSQKKENSMKEIEIIEQVVSSLVDDPASVKVNVVEGEKSVVLELHVKPGEVGKVIGRHGAIAKSLRTIVNAVAIKNGRKVILEILD